MGQRSISRQRWTGHTAAIPRRHHSGHTGLSARQHGQARLDVVNIHSRRATSRIDVRSLGSRPAKSSAVPSYRAELHGLKRSDRQPCRIAQAAEALRGENDSEKHGPSDCRAFGTLQPQCVGSPAGRNAQRARNTIYPGGESLAANRLRDDRKPAGTGYGNRTTRRHLWDRASRKHVHCRQCRPLPLARPSQALSAASPDERVNTGPSRPLDVIHSPMSTTRTRLR